MIKKIDGLLYKFANWYIMLRVKQFNYKKHKYRILGMTYRLDFVLVFAVLIGYVLDGAPMLVVSFFGCLLLGLAIFRQHQNKELSKLYDFLYMLRKDPMVYKDIKAYCKSSREDKFQYKIRVSVSVLFILLCSFVLIMDISLVLTKGDISSFPWLFYWPYLVFINIIQVYIKCVFDFDPPKKKKKKKKVSLTALVKKAWTGILKKPEFQPTPA